MRWALAGLLGLASCIGPRGFPCADDDVCRLGTDEGVCRAGYCAYVDDECPSGYRFEDQAGGGNAGACLDAQGGGSSSDSGGATWDCDSAPCDAQQLVLGRNHTCLTDDEQTLWCWGHNEHGQLGRGTNSFAEACPEPVVSDSLGRATLAAAADHTCILDEDGELFCWGRNDAGQVDPSVAEAVVALPRQLPLMGATVQRLDVGPSLSCASDDARVICWGDIVTAPGTAMFDVTLWSPIAALAAGGLHACAALTDGSIVCVGRDDVEQLGDGPGVGPDTTEQFATPLAAGDQEVIALDAGQSHTCAVMRLPVDGGTIEDVRCWGLNETGQSGAPSDLQPRVAQPTSVPALVGASYSQLSLGRDHSCVLVSDGRVQCWGDNSAGQVSPTVQSQPGDFGAHVVELVAGTPLFAVEIRAGAAHTCARTTGGDVWCWGDNTYGQLGLEGPGPIQLPLGCR
jgi:alpha-tubulin suppressor-like RCC1 family protein